MSRSRFWRKGVAVALIVLMLFVAAVMLTPAAGAVVSHYTYDPDQYYSPTAPLFLAPGETSEFDLTIGIYWGGESERPVETTMDWGCVCNGVDATGAFEFQFSPSLFTLDAGNSYSRIVTVTVTALGGAPEPKVTCKIEAWELNPPDPPLTPMGQGNGCHVYLETTTGEPEPPPGGCFIATAAYGTPLAEEIEVLRQFRDEYLLTNPAGSSFVSLYYKTSPPVAEFIDDYPALKPMVRAALLPAVALTTVAVSTTLVEKMAMAGGLVLVSMVLALWLRRRARRRGVIVVKPF